MSDLSTSEKWRSRGRRLVEKADALGDSKELLNSYKLFPKEITHQDHPAWNSTLAKVYVTKVELLSDAVDCFNKAVKTKSCAKEGASAHKNIAIVLGQLAVLRDDKEIFQVYKDIIYHCSRAMLYGMKARLPDQWFDVIRRECTNCVKNVVDSCSSDDVREGVRRLEDILPVISDNRELKYKLLTEICRLLITASDKEIDKRNYGVALAQAEECLTYLKEAELLVLTEEDKALAETLKRRVRKSEATASGMQKISKADDMLKNLNLEDQSDGKMPSLYLIIDLYMEAIQISENSDSDTAAEACNRLAVIYRKYLDNESRAAHFYKQSMQLAAASRKEQEQGMDA